MLDTASKDDFAATCHGVGVPPSPYLHEGRIARINAAKYEGQEIAGALHVVRDDDVVLEIGAGIGLVGAIIAKACRPRLVKSFEANPDLIPTIQALYDANDLTDRIGVENAVLFAASTRPDTVPFYLHKSYLGSSLTDLGAKTRKVVDVPTSSFADVCETFSPSVLVMDIEGGEQALLQDADLSWFRAIVLEFHPGVYGVKGLRGCKRILREAGFRRIDAVSTRTVWTCVREAAA